MIMTKPIPMEPEIFTSTPYPAGGTQFTDSNGEFRFDGLVRDGLVLQVFGFCDPCVASAENNRRTALKMQALEDLA